MHPIFDCWPPVFPGQPSPRFPFDRVSHLTIKVIDFVSSENGGAQ